MIPEEVRILLVDDEPDILEILEYNLSREGYQVKTAENGRKAVKVAKKFVPHLIVLDMMMPEMNGMETCKYLRKLPVLNDSIIVFLTALGEDQVEMDSYKAGADDFVTKPVRPKVFLSKIEALLRRVEGKLSGTIITIGDLVIDREEYKVTKGRTEIRLPRKEFELLALLASNPEKVFSREDILSAVWGHEVVVGGRTIDVHIRKLREKIGNQRIQTITGVGYKYSE